MKLDISFDIDIDEDVLNEYPAMVVLREFLPRWLEDKLDMARTFTIGLSVCVPLQDMSDGMAVTDEIQAFSNTVTTVGLSQPQVMPILGKLGVFASQIRNLDLTETVLAAFPPSVHESVHPTFILAVQQQAALPENSVWNFHTPLGAGGYEALVAWMDYYYPTEMANVSHPYRIAMDSISASTTRIDAVIAFIPAINPDEPANTEEAIIARLEQING